MELLNSLYFSLRVTNTDKFLYKIIIIIWHLNIHAVSRTSAKEPFEACFFSFAPDCKTAITSLILLRSS